MPSTPLDQKPQHTPYVPARTDMREFTLRALVIGLVLCVVLGAANAYLGLKAGMTIAATYPAAVIAMAVLRSMKGSILEENIARTVGSIGESIAAGAIFTVPAFSSICSTSISPSRCPSVRIYDCSPFGPSPGFPAGAGVFSNARLFPKIVVIPVKKTFNAGCGLFSFGSGGGGAACKSKTLRSVIDSYGLELTAPAPEHKRRPPAIQLSALPAFFIVTVY